LLSELDNYLHRIEDLHSQINQLLVDVPPDGLNWRPFGEDSEQGTNSLAVLAAHIAGAEHFWIAEVIAGYAPTRDRDAEFMTNASTASYLIQILDDTFVETKAILSTLSISDLDQLREARNKSIPVRWAILHVIDHTALHLGHMQITYQLWSQGKTQPSPYWYDRLPKGNQ
jgi:uncharacterized damage-inducible protein DinB